MNDVSHHEATMRFLYGYVVRKNISRPGTSHDWLTVRTNQPIKWHFYPDVKRQIVSYSVLDYNLKYHAITDKF